MTISIECTIGLTLALIVAMAIDLRVQKIPNYVSGATVAFALLCHVITGGLGGLIFSLKGLGLGLALLMPFYIFRMIGAGDVKLMGAVGAALGNAGILTAFLYIAVIGGVYSLIVLIQHHDLLKSFRRRFLIMTRTLFATGRVDYIPPTNEDKKVKLCYGVAISLGTMSYMLWEYMGYSSYSEFFSEFLSKVS